MREKGNINIFVSCVSLIVSVLAVCIAAYRTPALSFDYQGVLVDTLSLLVTVLVGWNIYSLVDLSRIRKEQKDAIKSFEELGAALKGEISSAKKEMKASWSIDMMEAVPIMIASQLGKDLAGTIELCLNTYTRSRWTGSEIAGTAATRYLRGIADILFDDGRECKETIRHLVSDLYGKVEHENVLAMRYDISLRKDADDARLLDLLFEISSGLRSLSGQDIQT